MSHRSAKSDFDWLCLRAAGKPATPFGKVGGRSPFGTPPKAKASSAAKPFTGAGNQNLFKEMDNLSPFMQPEQMEEKPWWQNISLGQVVSSMSPVPNSSSMHMVPFEL